jgi:hypothetical protein
VIHYHGLPLNPVLSMIRAMKGKHCMVSFDRPEQVAEACEMCQSVVLDNGAFAAWRNKREYDFTGYLNWAQSWLKHPAVDWCVIPDVIDGSEAENDVLLDEWNLDRAVSVPVWHLHESLDRLDRLVWAYPRVALGSSGEYREPGMTNWWHRMGEAMSVACDKHGYPRCKLHGLRMLDPVIFSHLPFASADSCNVARNVGMDSAWNGTYSPASKTTRAIILIERIEAHASAARWCDGSAGVQQKMDLFG